MEFSDGQTKRQMGRGWGGLFTDGEVTEPATAGA